jgi:hypothetical protein
MRAPLAAALFGARWSPRRLFGASDKGFWFDPSDMASMFQNSAGTVAASVDAPVGRILDKSGNGNHASQATASAQPMLRRDSAGRLYLDFDGVDDFLELTPVLYNAGAMDLVAAIRGNSQSDKRIYAEGRSTSTAPTYGPMGTNLSVGSRVAAHLRDDASTTRIAPGTVYFDGAFTGVERVVTVDDSGSSVRFRLDSGAWSTAFAYTRSTTTLDRAAIGCLPRTTNAFFFTGRVFGFVGIGRQLAATDLQTLERFQAVRMGLNV